MIGWTHTAVECARMITVAVSTAVCCELMNDMRVNTASVNTTNVDTVNVKK
jgi:hypothetical protein